MPTSLQQDLFGVLPSGERVYRFILKNEWLEVSLMTFGAAILALRTPDVGGRLENVVLGGGELADYLAPNKAYFGAVCGRYANRIAGASVCIDGVKHPLSANEGYDTTLHGGKDGFDARIWSARIVEQNGVAMTLESPDGDQGFPGNLTATITYTLEESSLRLGYECSADQATVVNLTNHAYFNLAGEGNGVILGHLLRLGATRYLPLDERYIPVGDLANVEGTPFDFITERAIGERIREPHAQLLLNRGYNHTYVVQGEPGMLRFAATVRDPLSGRVLTVQTTEAGIHLYTAGFLDGSHLSASGRPYVADSGFCLETQRFPDSPHHCSFPSTLLRPGETYQSETLYEFSVMTTR
ncbi:aldose epimerase family protein [Edaphobacter sp. DSM 109919]|uniref:Aldose 1-epimerase n=1 Tax=Edaphobacter paludis TaxID=3035702 RepID=A0AAU7CZ80_9BACT